MKNEDKLLNYSLEDIMGLSFGRYSKEIIQNRAIPDVRDGLKPVQRRILYGMLKNKNTHETPRQKSAQSVGYIMGKLHPHGDSSIYDAMVRLSQYWKQNHTLVDMDGNNGSMDGDPPAAYRYTEARLEKLATEMLRDIDKNTVNFAPNYDDKLLEPTVLPARYPNLLVNGTTGISSGYATNIPSHNLNEICDATIELIKDENTSLEKLQTIVTGPDFPTGGIIFGKEGLKNAYDTGRGKIFIRSVCEVVKEKNKTLIVVTQIPYDVNKQMLVKKIAEIVIDKVIDGITEVRDESGLEGLRIVIELKKDIDSDIILNYLYKSTDLQISYNFNMVVIANRRPMELGLIKILKYYIEHQREIVTRKFNFELEKAKNRYHIVEGLIKAISILDEVISIIRSSNNKADAKANLIKEYQFSEIQAEEIVTLQLYRLTNTDIKILEDEKARLDEIIANLIELLNEPKLLDKKIINDLKEIKKEYGKPRHTKIEDDFKEVKIDTESLISKEDVIVVVTKDGYIKRVSERSYASRTDDTMNLKENDYIIGFYKVSTLDTILVFTDLGNYLYLRVHLLPELKYKEIPKHVNTIVDMNPGEKVIACYPVTNFELDINVVIATNKGMIKRVKLNEFKATRYTKPLTMMKLKKDDNVVSVCIGNEVNLLLTSNTGYGLWYDSREIPITSLKASGVKSMALKDDVVTNVNLFSNECEYLTLITNKGSGKRIKISDLEKSGRAKRGLILFKENKSNPGFIIKSFTCSIKDNIGLISENDLSYVKLTEIKVMDRYSSLSSLTKETILNSFVKVDLVESNDMNNNDVITYEELTPIVDKEQEQIPLF